MKQLLILSGKGGTGKTTVASAFIKLAKAKAYVDCDVDAPNLHLVMRHEVTPKRSNYHGLDKAKIDEKLCIQCDLCRQNCRFDAIVVKDGYTVDDYGCEGCGVCEQICPTNAIVLRPAVAGELMLYMGEQTFSTAQLRMGSGNSGLLVTDVKKQLKSAAPNTDLAIIDGSPGIGCPVIASLNVVDMVLIVAEPSISGISDMERIIETANRFQVTMAVCINKYNTNIQKTKMIEEFCMERKISIVGKIPFDQKVVRVLNQGKSIVDIDCDASRATKSIFDKTMEILLHEV